MAITRAQQARQMYRSAGAVQAAYGKSAAEAGPVDDRGTPDQNFSQFLATEGFTPKHPNIFNQYKDIQLLFEKLIDLVIDTTINCKWKNRDWNINNVIVDKNNKFHLIDLDSVTDNYYYENVIASVNRWDINGVRVDNHLRNRLKILENV